MRWFKDDFYSPRISRRLRKQIYGKRTYGRRTWPLPPGWTAFAALLVGVLIMFVLFVVWGRGDDSNPQTAQEPLPVEIANMQDLIIHAVNQVNPAVVTIMNGRQGQSGQINDLGMGSGVIFDIVKGKALIVTNQHVIENGDSFEAVLPDGEHREARLIGKDAITDLAVVEIDAKGITVKANFGSSTDLQAGQTAIAIGNPLGLGYSQSITVGVVSSPMRTIRVSASASGDADTLMDVIQIDAAINWGNSGGALVDLYGDVIGINSMKVAESGVEGLGFALPIDRVKPILDSLLQYGRVKRPLIGVSTLDLQVLLPKDRKPLNLPDGVEKGVVVMEVQGPAQAAGLQADDVIVQLDDTGVSDILELRKYLYDHKQIGDVVDIHYYRDGKKKLTKLLLAEKLEE